MDHDAKIVRTMTLTHTRIGHVHLKVRDLDRAREFYAGLLGLTVTEQVGRYLFLSYGEEHHDVALKEVGPAADGPRPDAVGLYHFAIEVPAVAEFKAFYRRLRQAGISLRPVDHGISKALYFQDPDGNGIEVYVDTRIMETGRAQWHGESSELDVEALSAG